MTTEIEAAEAALRDLDRAKGRTGAFSAYARSGPAFIVWGLVWLVANTTQQFAPDLAVYAWAVGISVGIAASIWTGMRARAHDPDAQARKPVSRYIISATIVGATIFAVFNILGVRDPRDANAVVSLVVAAAYCLVGVWTGSRFLWVGLVLGALIIGGWVWMKEQFDIWMGVVGGGVLILTGFWLGRS